MRVLPHYRLITGFLILGVVIGLVLYYQSGLDLQQYRVVPISSAGPTPSKPTTIENNHVTYPILPPPDQKEIEFRREGQLEKIDEVLAGDIPKLREWNVKQLEALKEYWLGAETVTQPKVVLATNGYVPCATRVCSTVDWVVWLESVINSFQENNHYLLYTEYENLGRMYKKLGDIVTHVWSTDEHVVWCFNDTISCIESAENPGGIPPWKLFTLTFQGSRPGWPNFFAPREPWSYNPLGGEWNVVPHRMPDKHFYLGYHFTGCEDLPYIPYSERKDQVVILAERSEYYHHWAFLNTSVWPVIKNKTGFDMTSVAKSEEGYPVPVALTQVEGSPERYAYDSLLASAKVIIGIGRPRVSPSPYASLCRGVPVIIPYKGTKCPAQPGDSNWCEEHHQHGPAADIGPPYVYAVDCEGPIDDIVETIITAVNTPIDPYIPPDMTKEALSQRIQDYFSIDWKVYSEQKMQLNSWSEVRTQPFMYRWLEKHPVKPQKPE